MGDGTDASFEAAVAAVKQLQTDPGNEVKLRLYGLYKQATSGDVTDGRPGAFNPVGRSKHDAWARLAGTSREDAAAQYVAIADDLTAP
jgi:diazepam-binding inhibitor (GABA receptor modulating acyl-CoA-binding protein)